MMTLLPLTRFHSFEGFIWHFMVAIMLVGQNGQTCEAHSTIHMYTYVCQSPPPCSPRGLLNYNITNTLSQQQRNLEAVIECVRHAYKYPYAHRCGPQNNPMFSLRPTKLIFRGLFYDKLVNFVFLHGKGARFKSLPFMLK